MAEWFLGISTFMIAMLVLSDIFGNRKEEARAREIDFLRKGLQMEADRRDKFLKLIESVRAECLASLGEKYQQLSHFNADLAIKIDNQETKVEETFLVVRKEFEKFTKEFGVIEVRQRTMEKKIISNERTVNIRFNGPVPVEHVPHVVTKERKKRGLGRGAVIPEGTA